MGSYMMDRLRDSVIYFYGHKSKPTGAPKNGVVKPEVAVAAAEQSSKDSSSKLISNSYEKTVDTYADKLLETIVGEVIGLSLTNTSKWCDHPVYHYMAWPIRPCVVLERVMLKGRGTRRIF